MGTLAGIARRARAVLPVQAVAEEAARGVALGVARGGADQAQIVAVKDRCARYGKKCGKKTCGFT